MANWCYAGISAFFEDEKDAVAVEKLLQQMEIEANKKDEGLDLGMIDNWLLYTDGRIERDKHSVSIQGEIRWGFEHSQIKGLSKWFMDKGASEVSAEYEELSNNVIGNWVVDKKDSIVRINYLPHSHELWNEYHKGDALMQDLEDEDYSVREFNLKGESDEQDN